MRQLLRDQPPSRKWGAAWLSGPSVVPPGHLRPPSIVTEEALWREINRRFLDAHFLVGPAVCRGSTSISRN